MLTYIKSFSGFSVDDIQKAKEFYSEKLGIEVREEEDMGLSLHLADDAEVFIYPKANHQPATFTILNFVVDDIDAAVDSLKNKGVQLIHYQDTNLPQDENGILRGLKTGMGPDVAWFEDPAGNILSVLQEE